MRIFQRESELIREAAYQNFIVYCNLWYKVAHLYSDNPDEEFDCPEAHRAYERAMSQKEFADFLDPQGRYSFYSRYRQEVVEKSDENN